MSTNDEPKSRDDLLKKYQEQTEEKSRDYSKAAASSITTPSEDEQKKRGIAEGIISDLANQRSEIDVIKQAIQVLSSQQNEIAKMLNQQTQILNQLSQGTTAANPEIPKQGLNLDSINALGEVAEKLANVWKAYKGGDTTQDNFTQTIVDRSKKEAIESLDIVSLINQKVKKSLVNDIAGNVAGHVLNDTTETSHAPQ